MDEAEERRRKIRNLTTMTRFGLSCSAGELNPDELERIVTIMQNPGQFKIPNWFVNRQKDIVDGKYGHLLSNQLDSKMREDLERLKKIRNHRGLRTYWGLRVRGQHTKTTGRRGKTVGVVSQSYRSHSRVSTTPLTLTTVLHRVLYVLYVHSRRRSKDKEPFAIHRGRSGFYFPRFGFASRRLRLRLARHVLSRESGYQCFCGLWS